MGIDGTERKAKGRAGTRPPAPPRPGPDGPAKPPQVPGQDERHQAILSLLSEDTGWLRIVPSENGRTIYFKWKWTCGSLKNRYVMTVGAPEQLFDMLAILEDKRRAAERGEGPSAKDTYHAV